MSDTWWAKHRSLRRRLYWWVPPRPFSTDPYELAFGTMFAVYGLTSLVLGTDATPDSFDDTQPAWVVLLWALCFFLGGGSLVLGRWQGWLRIEAAGLVVVSAPLLFYAGTIWYAFGRNGLLSVLNLSTLAAANWMRWTVVKKGLRAEEAAREELRRARFR